MLQRRVSSFQRLTFTQRERHAESLDRRAFSFADYFPSIPHNGIAALKITGQLGGRASRKRPPPTPPFFIFLFFDRLLAENCAAKQGLNQFCGRSSLVRAGRLIRAGHTTRRLSAFSECCPARNRQEQTPRPRHPVPSGQPLFSKRRSHRDRLRKRWPFAA